MNISSPSIQIRPLIAADQANVLQHWYALRLELPKQHQQPFGEPLPEVSLQQLDVTLAQCIAREDATVLVAVADQVVGSVALVLNEQSGFSRPHSGIIFNLWVDERVRRQGIGQELVLAAKRWLQAAGAQSVQAGWHPDNHVADQFWRAQGFSAYEIIGACGLKPEERSCDG